MVNAKSNLYSTTRWYFPVINYPLDIVLKYSAIFNSTVVVAQSIHTIKFACTFAIKLSL